MRKTAKAKKTAERKKLAKGKSAAKKKPAKRKPAKGKKPAKKQPAKRKPAKGKKPAGPASLGEAGTFGDPLIVADGRIACGWERTDAQYEALCASVEAGDGATLFQLAGDAAAAVDILGEGTVYAFAGEGGAIVIVRVWSDGDEKRAARSFAAAAPAHRTVGVFEVPSGKLVLIPGGRSGAEIDLSEKEVMEDDGSSGLGLDVPAGRYELLAALAELEEGDSSARWFAVRPAP